MPDIDIDFVNRDEALKHFKHIRASRIDDNKLVKHNTGVYMHEVLVNAETNLCAIPHKEAEDVGYFKLDFLNVGIYKDVKDEKHLDELIEKEPVWELLLEDDFTDLLFHVNGHGDLLRKLRPDTVEKLAAVLAMIRPAKRHLVDEGWNIIMSEVWNKPSDDAYFFKKSHATAYALAVKVQMNLLSEGVK